MVQEKNAHELFQNFLWHMRDIDISQAKKDPGAVLTVDMSKAKDDGETGASLISLGMQPCGTRRTILSSSPTRRSGSSSPTSTHRPRSPLL
jgi:hypothetical protein